MACVGHADCLQLLAPVVRHKLTSADELGPEWGTLLAGVPGSYAVQQPASPRPSSLNAMSPIPKAPQSGSGLLQQAQPSAPIVSARVSSACVMRVRYSPLCALRQVVVLPPWRLPPIARTDTVPDTVE